MLLTLWAQFLFQHDNARSISEYSVKELCWPTQSHPALLGLIGMLNVSQASGSVADLTNALGNKSQQGSKNLVESLPKELGGCYSCI